MKGPRRTEAGDARHLRVVIDDHDGDDAPEPSPVLPKPSGRLATETGETLPVTITEVGNDLLLVPLTDLGNLLTNGVREFVFESMSPRGLVRVHGKAEWVEDDLVRFEADSDPELVQRRNYYRIVTAQRVRVDGQNGERVVTRSLDVSGGGMLLSGMGAFDLGLRIDFHLTLAESDPPIAGGAHVVRIAEGSDGRRGIVFDKISRTDRERLVHFVFDRQRHARAFTRADDLRPGGTR